MGAVDLHSFIPRGLRPAIREAGFCLFVDPDPAVDCEPTFGFSDRLPRIRLCFILLKLIDRIFQMAKSLAQLKKQIAALERQADAIKQKETKDVVARIKEAIAFYDLSAEQLGLSVAKRPGRKPGAAKSGRKPAASGRKRASKVKYRDEAGNSWSGHGRRPKWFLDALAGGKTAQDLSV